MRRTHALLLPTTSLGPERISSEMMPLAHSVATRVSALAVVAAWLSLCGSLASSTLWTPLEFLSEPNPEADRVADQSADASAPGKRKATGHRCSLTTKFG
eukprot:6935670-Prymnesium_polylepis.1